MISKGLTESYIQFARNEIVLCYTGESKYRNKINQNNWYKILSKPDVKFAFGNPNADPGGYRAVMAVQLAEIYYENASIFNKLITKNTDMNSPEKENGKFIIKTKKLTNMDRVS